MVWALRLNVTNGTDRELTVSAPDLKWGWWYTDNTDDKKPVSIAPGETAYALGIRASRGTWTGYECSCTWLDKTKPSYGAVSIYVDVPYVGNSSGIFNTSGLYSQEGWTPLEKKSSSFTRNVTITAMMGALQVERDDTLREDEEDADYVRYMEMELASNLLFQNWSELEALEEVDQFDAAAAMPDKYMYPPKEFFIARGEIAEIEKSDWPGVGDSVYSNNYAKQSYVDRYFAVPVYSINTNPRATEPVPAGVRKTTMRYAEVVSTIHSTLETNLSIKTSLEAEASDKISGQRVAAKLESDFSIRNVLEESTTRIDKEETKIEIEPADYDRLFVPWVFSTTVAIYCQTKKGEFRLVAISQWAVEQLYRTYKV
ncbi:hypothetical protein [Aliiroseovarius sp. YM-037]|uniref:hypothetical protein n=1 Tax=Aliiroseovarius sp. YM-037 TaxID=3341728 RepID=UPI003A80B67B